MSHWDFYQQMKSGIERLGRLYDRETLTIPERRSEPRSLSIEWAAPELPKHAVKVYEKRSKELIDKLVWHHSGGNPNATPHAIARYHVMKRGWPGIAYHYLIYPDGRIVQVQPLTAISYHCGNFNSTSVGICVMGDLTKQHATEAQMESAALLLRKLRKMLSPRLQVFRHGDLRPTRCPAGLNIQEIEKMALG